MEPRKVETTEYGYRNGELLVTIANGDAQRLTRFVTYLYYGALQRDPTTQELTDKITQLAAAGATSQSQLLTVASQIARSLFTSTNYETSPYRSDLQYTADLYYAYLQRGPDDGGLNFWAGQAAGSRVNVCNAFEASGEFQTLVANLYGTAASDNERTEHFVNNFYLGAYGRNATSTELQQQRDALNTAAAQGLSQVQAQAETFGRSLFTGQVNDATLSNTQYVTNLYEAFLQRGPDAGGLGFWAGQASVGQGRQNVLGAFATSGAFYQLAGTLYREANWLVADQLGTPRMIVNKSGSLASVKRHDYLPFGEELYALTGGRTTTQGYVGDSVRQKFTSKERDIETGLDFFQARYYASTQGRFTTVDPEQEGARNDDPQSWNGYAYARNSPLVYTDPNGRNYRVCDSNGKNCVDYTDKEFDKLRKGGPADGYNFKNGNIYYNGELTATYSNDCLFCGTLVNEMAARGPAVKKLVGAFAVASLAGGLTGGTAYYFLAPAAGSTVTTLGLGTTATSAAGTEASLASLSIQQLNGIIRGTQRELLSRLFGQGMEGAQQAIASGEVPAGLTRQTLMVAKEIAQRAIAKGIDKGGVQAARLKIIQEALKKIK